jgi:hypothetical protein
MIQFEIFFNIWFEFHQVPYKQSNSRQADNVQNVNLLKMTFLRVLFTVILIYLIPLTRKGRHSIVFPTSRSKITQHRSPVNLPSLFMCHILVTKGGVSYPLDKWRLAPASGHQWSISESLSEHFLHKNGMLVNICTHIRRRLDRSAARYIYKAKNRKLLVVLTPSQKAKLIFEQYIQTLFNKDLF